MKEVLITIGWILVGIGGIRYARDPIFSEYVGVDKTTWILVLLGVLAWIISAFL